MARVIAEMKENTMLLVLWKHLAEFNTGRFYFFGMIPFDRVFLIYWRCRAVTTRLSQAPLTYIKPIQPSGTFAPPTSLQSKGQIRVVLAVEVDRKKAGCFILFVLSTQ